MTLDDRVVLVTGATGPVGRSVASTFADEGARLVLAGTDRDRLVAMAAELALPEHRWVPAAGDLRDPAGARDAVAVAMDRFGRLDILLHLVGGWVGGTAVVDLDPVELRGMLDQHLWSTLHVAKAAVPIMVEHGWGRVIAVSSPFAAEPGPRGASYAIAKSAEEVLLRTLSRELGGTGVTANIVVVRTVDTKHERETAPSPKNASWTTPEEVAAAMLLLCQPGAAAINGVRIPLYGRS
jgi:NAD(P)-dependent dehydrogenase (short-subunit alcohol dehydrogenase family)